MAQRTGAERFLALPAKSTSAGVALALVLAAFLLSGCGGGSSDSEGTAAAESQAAVSEDPSSNAAVSPQGAGAGAGSKADPTSSAGAAGNASGSDHSGSNAADGGQGQKHGPRIATPKGPTEQAPTPKQVASATVADMSLQSPAILAANGSPGQLAATYTCDGNDSWPKLRWSGVPDGTAELILYAMSVQPVEEQLFVDWAVAGLDPSLEGIEAGQLPKGAIVGTNGFGKRGYDICPSGTGEIYMFAIYALPQSLAPAKGFDARELRRQILAVSGNVGLLPAVYARG